MSSSQPRQKDRYFTLRGNALKRWVRIHLWVYRATRGRLLGKMRGMPTLLLTTTGRRSGRRHTVPLPYFTDGVGKVVIGSFAGSDTHPAWVVNVKADAAVEVQDRGDVYPGRAEIVTGDERTALWADLVQRSPWYADYQQQTAREIPLVRITDARPK
ncbi:MAG: nitroreductase family deazaflavin-dependent oxidoreductase [Actinobacteria bacterium]|nr:nitroreductase family deazaflavin-dependent oxidoreductase [Actinomycetota bacterium]